jgi:site-specific DNA recombinase
MKNAGAIIRVSTVGQLDNTSIENQREAIIKTATDQGFSILSKHLWEFAESGGLKERKGFELARQAVEKKEVSQIYVYSITRLGREVETMLAFLRDMEDENIPVFCIEDKQVIDREDLMLQIKAVFSAHERREINKRTYNGLKRTVRDGHFSGGIVSYGYNLDPTTKRLIINPEEAKVAELIFKLCAEEKMSTTKIAEYLNARSIPTKYQNMPNPEGKRKITQGIWRYGRINQILKNTVYKGTWVWGKRNPRKEKTHEKRERELISSTCPAIVSEEIWEAAQVVLQNNRLFLPTTEKRFYLLRGLIKCKTCGHTFCGSYSRIAKGEKRYYRCNGKYLLVRKGETGCDSPTINADQIEAYVWNAIKGFVNNPNRLTDEINKLKNGVDDNAIRIELTDIEKSLVDLDNQLRNFILMSSKLNNVDLTVIDKMAEETNVKKQTLTQRKAELNEMISKLKQWEYDQDYFPKILREYSTKIQNPTELEKREFILDFVDKIEVTWGEIKNYPRVDIFYKFQKVQEIQKNIASKSEDWKIVIMDHTDTDSWPRSIENWLEKSASPAPG